MKLTKVLLAGLFMFPAQHWAQETANPSVATVAVSTSSTAQVAPGGIGPGDLMTVHMFDFPDVGAVQVHVGADGTIHLPYAGAVHVVGLLPDGVQKAIEDALRSRGVVKEPIVTVEMVSATNLNVTVIGQVASPRSLPLYAPAPLAYVIGLVGGLTGLASPHLTIIHSGDRVPTAVEWNPDNGQSEAFSTIVQPGDIINVSARGVYFMEGEINRPGIYPLGGVISAGTVNPTSGMGFLKEITLLQALAQAGGITPIAARSKMHILRSEGGKREDIVVDQVKLSKGEVADPLLHANDIIYLPSSYIRQQTNNLFGTALSGLYAATSIKQTGFY